MSAFDKVIGYEKEKEELIQLCDMAKHAEKYAALGVTLPRGVLLHGVPGVGKTLMASALVEEMGRKSFILRKDKSIKDFVDEIGKTFARAKEAAPSVQEALEQFAAFAENAILVGYHLPFDCKFLDFYGAQCGVVFPADRVDLLPIAKRLLGKSVKSYTLPAVWKELKGGRTDNRLETCMQCAEAAADLAGFLPYWQRSRHNETPFYRIIVPRRKIRLEIGHAEFVIAINLMRCALFGKDHPLFPLWVYKCAEKLEYVSRFVDKKDEKLPQRYYEMIFTGYNEAVWETKERLEGSDYALYGEYEITDELCERVFAIYDAVRVSCMPYLMSRTETYHPDEYASIIIQAVETEGKNREIKIDYNRLDPLYNGFCG